MFSMPSGRTLVAGPFPEDTWFLNPPGPSNSYTWQDYPEHADRPALGHGGADARRHGRLDPGHAAGRLHHRRHDHLSNATTEIFDEANPGLGWRAAPSHARRPRPPQHRAAARRLDGHRRRRRRHPKRRPVGRPTPEPAPGRALESGDRQLDARARAGRERAPTTRPRCCSRTGASCRRATTSTAAPTATPPRSTSRPTSSRARARRSTSAPASAQIGDQLRRRHARYQHHQGRRSSRPARPPTPTT